MVILMGWRTLSSVSPVAILSQTFSTHFPQNPFSTISLSHRSSFHYSSSSSSAKSPIFLLTKSSSMENPKTKEFPLGIDEETEQQYSLHSNLLQQFTSISSIDKSWIFNSNTGMMFSVSQPNLLANKKRKFILSSTVNKRSDGSVGLDWAPFPVEMTGVSVMVPSPSGSKLLIVRNPEGDGGCKFEIWSNSCLENEFSVPQSKHGSVYADGWFEGISWNSDETRIAYVAEEPSPAKPTFNDQGYKVSGSDDKDSSSWKGQGDWEEDWGETYAGKRQPALFVINITSGEVQAVKGIDKSLSVGQVVWAPSSEGSAQYLVFVGWSYETRKLGIKYCYNRACALYAVKAPHESKPNENEIQATEDVQALKLTQTISSAFLPRFSPDGNFLVFLSARSSVDSGAHSATNSLHRIDWPKDVKLYQSAKVHDVIPVVLCADDDGFPGLYFSSILSDPWLSDGHTLIIPSVWHSSQVLLSVNVFSGQIKRITPADSNFSWSLLTLHGNNIFAVSSSPVDVPQVKYGTFVEKEGGNSEWRWSDVSNPIYKCSDKVRSLLSSLTFSIMKISVKEASENPTKGSCKPYESIFVSSKTKKSDACDPLIVVLHGGPHSVSLSSFSKSQAFLSSLGYSLLIVNYRGSLGFGEEALQSLPGNIGSQDVNDVLSAIDHVIDLGLASPSKIAVLGGSHGGFLTTHLIGQAPEKFVAAAARNPVCNLELMVGTTDIPDWCFVESYGTNGRDRITEAPSAEDLTLFYSKSPIAHLSKVKTPTVFLLGAQDLRVPISTGLQYARALKEKGVPVKVILFPNDVHGIDRPQSDFESFLSIAAWFNKYCK
ncbi:acylamino-acid-releasing enzyme isoform X3 [Medicago truncatula]|uniref:acylamino-acid-releasing enzyme isoform X3 n=1 Tax=Medicago truncatula TaxID=3880 RepID=UPI001966D3E7|nr:acylamino-acid-releasing enzyme isoform X3 [Medicago truncatula]